MKTKVQFFDFYFLKNKHRYFRTGTIYYYKIFWKGGYSQ